MKKSELHLVLLGDMGASSRTCILSFCNYQYLFDTYWSKIIRLPTIGERKMIVYAVQARLVGQNTGIFMDTRRCIKESSHY